MNRKKNYLLWACVCGCVAVVAAVGFHSLQAESMTRQAALQLSSASSSVSVPPASGLSVQAEKILRGSEFQNFKDYREAGLGTESLVLCARVHEDYIRYLTQVGSQFSGLSSADGEPTGLLIDASRPDAVSSGLFYFAEGGEKIHFVILDFDKSGCVGAHDLGVVSEQSKAVIPMKLERQKLDRSRAEQIAETFGVDLNDYLPAQNLYSPAYGAAELSPYLMSSLRGTLTGAAATENIDYVLCFVRKDYSGGVLLNSNEDGMRYCHRFQINRENDMKDRFAFSKTERKLCEPISNN